MTLLVWQNIFFRVVNFLSRFVQRILTESHSLRSKFIVPKPGKNYLKQVLNCADAVYASLKIQFFIQHGIKDLLINKIICSNRDNKKIVTTTKCLVLSTKRLVAAANFLVAATKNVFVVPNFVAITRSIFFSVNIQLNSHFRRKNRLTTKIGINP